jgi:glycosyltransferase involved in cell wall biosynthesis
MKILYGITKSNFGGAQRYVFDLAREAKLAGHDVAVICGGAGALVQKLEQNHIRVILLPHLKRDISLVDEFRSFHFIFRTLVEENPDVFHTNSSKMGGIGNLAARFAGVRNIIFTGHGWAFNEERPFYQKPIIKLFVWLTILLSHKTICVSRKTRADVDWPIANNKLTVINNGIESFTLLPRFAARLKLGVEENTLVVGTLAELHPTKGLDVLLHAWEKFSKRGGSKLFLFGEGEELQRLENLTLNLQIKDSVVFPGFVANARELLLAFDIFVLPSRSEALPYTILEAGFAGLPIISSKAGGIPEVIKTGDSGVLVEPGNPDEIHSSLLLLSDDKGLRSRLGEKLKETVQKSFSIEEMIAKTFSLY